MNKMLSTVLANNSEIKQMHSVYGVVLNDEISMQKIGPKLQQKPYQTPPKSPVLYIKPRNTWASSGVNINLPEGEKEVEVGACLGLVIGANQKIKSHVCVADLSLPHGSYYRPAIREKCFDGSCVISEPIAKNKLADPDNLDIQIYINDKLVETRNTNRQLDTGNELIRKISEFIALNDNDIVLTGVEYQAPIATVGSKIEIGFNDEAKLVFQLSESQ